MKRTLTILVMILYLKTFGQTPFCKVDTFDLTLAYEIGGQFSLDDQIIKSPGFVKFNGKITMQNYINGYFELPYFESGSAYRLSKLCNIAINKDSLVKHATTVFDSLTTKTWIMVNNTYAGKGKTMLDTEIITAPLQFKYKVFQVKFLAVYIGDVQKTLINFERKSKKEKQLIDIKCSQYIITKIIDIKTLK